MYVVARSGVKVCLSLLGLSLLSLLQGERKSLSIRITTVAFHKVFLEFAAATAIPQLPGSSCLVLVESCLDSFGFLPIKLVLYMLQLDRKEKEEICTRIIVLSINSILFTLTFFFIPPPLPNLVRKKRNRSVVVFLDISSTRLGTCSQSYTDDE